MNTANVMACIIISMLFGFGVGYATGQQNDGKFTIHKTRSGMFIVDDTTSNKGKAEAKIYEVLGRSSMKTYSREQRLHLLTPSKDRAKLRSKTYQGIADAMASQWRES